MDLWIRSQDREVLTKIENVSIDNENYILGNLVSDDNKSICDYWRLGNYKSKERALEVLDEIQSKIAQNECLKLMMPKLSNIKGEEEKIGKFIKEMIYEMPKD